MNQIKVYGSVAEMSGKGEEWLVDPQEPSQVRAVFIDGNFRCQILYIKPKGSEEQTAVLQQGSCL